MKRSIYFPNALFLALFNLFCAAAEAPHFDPPQRLANGAVDLNLRGTAGASYAIDRSTNLFDWFLVASGIANNGVFSVRDDAASNYPTIFYRGRSATEQLPPITLELAVNTNTTVSSVMTLEGGSATLYGANGARYTLTLPTNSIPEPTVFSMSEVTNITNLPFAGPIIGAVRLDPPNLALWGAATLEITFRPNVDRRKIASFTTRNNGSAFQLTLDRVTTNRVLIPVTRAGVYGSSIVTEADIADAARRAIGEATAASIAAKKTELDNFTAQAADCQAAKKAAAQALANKISSALAVRWQADAAKVTAERQKQLTGTADDSPSVMGDIADDLCSFYQSDVAPHWSDAASNCAAGKVVTQFALNIERQLQLLGSQQDCIQLSSFPLCAMLGNCLDEIEECCIAGNRGSAKVADVWNLERQDQLLGSACISRDRAQQVIDECSSNIWTGSFTLTANSYTNTTRTSGFGTTTTVDSYKSKFEGSVIESYESGSAAVGYTLQLRVSGQITIDELRSQSFRAVGCSGSDTLQSSETVVATNTEYTIYISTDPSGKYSLHELNQSPTKAGVDGKRTEIDLRITRSCNPDTPDIVSNRTTTSNVNETGYSLPFYQGTWTDPNEISGIQTFDDTGNQPVPKMSAQWNFKRRKSP